MPRHLPIPSLEMDACTWLRTYGATGPGPATGDAITDGQDHQALAAAPNQPPQIRRPANSRRRIGADARQAFLEQLAFSGNVSEACANTSISRAQIYREAERNQAFRDQWHDAMTQAGDLVRAEALRRAMEGVPIPRTDHGKIAYDWNGKPIEKRRYSDALLIYLIESEDGSMEYRRKILMGDVPPALPAPKPKALPPPMKQIADGREQKPVEVYRPDPEANYPST